MPQLKSGVTRRGAQMGRPSHPGTMNGEPYDWVYPDQAAPKDLPRTFALRRIGPDADGYDEAGAYWGIGDSVYWAHDRETGADHFVRAKSPDEAKALIESEYPTSTIYELKDTP